MFEREKLSHIIAVALLLVATQIIVFMEYFDIVGREENSFASAVSHIVPNCALTECPSPQVINQTIFNAERDLWAFNMGDSIVLYWADLPSRAMSLVFYQSESKNGPWLKVISLPVTDSMPQQVVDSLTGDRVRLYRAEALADDGAILKSYSILQLPTYVGDGSEEHDVFTWQTYHNEEYGFEFQYAPDWSVREDAGLPVLWQNDQQMITFSIVDMSVLGITYCNAYSDTSGCSVHNGWTLDSRDAQKITAMIDYQNGAKALVAILDKVTPTSQSYFEEILSTFKYWIPHRVPDDTYL